MVDETGNADLNHKLQHLSSQVRQSTKAKADAATVDILTYDVNEVWNEYMENPALLDHNKWEFLASKLDILTIDKSSKTNFCIFRAEYDKEPEEKIIVTPEVTPVSDFKQMLRNIMKSELSMKDVEHHILRIKNELTLDEEDLKDCLHIVK